MNRFLRKVFYGAQPVFRTDDSYRADLREILSALSAEEKTINRTFESCYSHHFAVTLTHRQERLHEDRRYIECALEKLPLRRELDRRIRVMKSRWCPDNTPPAHGTPQKIKTRKSTWPKIKK